MPVAAAAAVAAALVGLSGAGALTTVLTSPAPRGEPRVERVALSVPRWESSTGIRPGRVSVPAPEKPRRPADPADPVPPTAELEPPRRPWFLNYPGLPPRIELAPMRSCPKPHGALAQIAVVTEVGRGALSLTWQASGLTEVTGYRLVAVPAPPRPSATALPIRTATVDAPTGCREVTATVTGLPSGERYQVHLESISGQTVNPAGHRYPDLHRMLARSEVVTVR
jgi:hypothetical protein